MKAWDLDAVADSLQLAALDHTIWPRALAGLSQTVEGAGALIFSVGDTLLIGPASSPDLESMSEDYVREGWPARDERLRAVPILLKTGISVDQDFMSPDDISRNDYYQDFLARHGRRWFAGLGFKTGGDLWCLSVQRTIARGPFEPWESQRLASLLRPLSDAATLSRHLSFARVLGIADGFELIAQPCVLLTDRAKVLALNESAEGLVGDMINVLHRTLEFRDSSSQNLFDSLLLDVVSGKPDNPKSPVGVVRDRKGRSISLRMIGLRGLARFSFIGARVLLLIGSPKVQSTDTTTLIKSTYGLTTGETNLAVELCAGYSLVQAANKLGITYETARSRLKIIYHKTDTNRQGQLVALLSSLRKT